MWVWEREALFCSDSWLAAAGVFKNIEVIKHREKSVSAGAGL